MRKVETVSGTTTDTRFAYDSAGRLTTVRQDGVVQVTYEYDANGNRTRKTSAAGVEVGVVDAQDRLMSYGGASFRYADGGELVMKVVGSDTTRYTYAIGALRSVRLPDGRRIDYLIDPLGRRIGRSVDGVVTQRFLYESELRIAAELTATGAVRTRFVYGMQVNVPEYMERDGVRYRIVTDHLGSVRMVVDVATGMAAQRIDYDEYGRVTANTNPGFQPFGYAGGLVDDLTAHVRFGARDYWPAGGRWTTPDPSGFLAGSANMYGYSGSDPVTRNDPSGLRPLRACERALFKGYVSRLVLDAADVHEGTPWFMLPGFSVTLGATVNLVPVVYKRVQNGELLALGTLLHELVHVAQYIEDATPDAFIAEYVRTLSHDNSAFELHADAVRRRFLEDMARGVGSPCGCSK